MIFWLFGTLLIGYLVLSLILFFIQERMIFWPKPLAENYQFQFRENVEELNLEFPNGVKLNCLHFKIKNPKGCVVYHHGNADNLVRWGEKHHLFTQNGYDFFVYDYRSFGKSKGRLSEYGLFRDAQRIFNYVKIHYPEERIIQYGISLGSGVATKLAAKIMSPLLILETPYLSMYHMAKLKVPFLLNSLILKFHIRTDKFIKKINASIYIFHGTNDELVPYEQGEKLASLNEHAKLITIEGGLHNNLQESHEYKIALKNILESF